MQDGAESKAGRTYFRGRVHPLFTLCVPTWPVKTAFNSSQFTRLLRKEERNPEDVRRPAPGIERNSEWLFAVP